MEQNKNWKEDFKTKAEDLKNTAIDKASAAWDWAKANPQYSIPLALSCAKIAEVTIRHACRMHKFNTEEIERRSRIWDPQLGYYHRLRRPMTSEEIRYYNRMLEAGMTRFDILDQMRILK